MDEWVHTRARFVGVATIVVLLAAASGVSGGSVFMKNGYIVQGPIADNTPEHVVVEWPKGRVVIPRRFVLNVVLDATEERKIQERHVERPAETASFEGTLDLELYLPPDPAELMPGRRPSGTDTGGRETPAPVVLPSVELVERQELSPTLSGSLPLGWTLHRERDAWVAEGPAHPGSGRKPRIAGTVLARDVNRRAQIALALEETQKTFGNWQTVEEGYREVGMREGYEIAGHGEHDGVEVQARQLVAWVGDRAWLISCVWPSESDAARQIEWCLQTFEFAATPAK
jgi:hypothetical protein